jgi:hypothetical protein
METLTGKYTHTKSYHKRLNYERHQQQRHDQEVPHSNERSSVSAVSGASAPLTRLGGFIRRIAIRYSESSWGHWFPLIFADKANVWEGFLRNFRKSRGTNKSAERGLKAEWKNNRTAFVTKTAVKVVVAAAVFAWLMKGSKRETRAKVNSLRF